MGGQEHAITHIREILESMPTLDSGVAARGAREMSFQRYPARLLPENWWVDTRS